MEPVCVRSDDRGVVRITLNRPEVRNALDGEVIAGVCRAVATLPSGARVVVLAGEGKVFSAGADLGWMLEATPDAALQGLAELAKMLRTLDEARVPVVARVQGAAIAGATGLVAVSDVAIAAEGTTFAFTEVRLGLVPAVICPWVLRRVGYSFARAAFLTARRFDAVRAREAGLVDEVVAEDDLDEAVERTVSEILSAAPGALHETRRILDEVAGRPPSEVEELTVASSARSRTSDDGREGVAAFFEKRPPAWAAGRRQEGGS